MTSVRNEVDRQDSDTRGTHLLPLEERFRGRRVLVTGGAGFIGSHLSERLLELGASVRVFDDFSTGLRSSLSEIADDDLEVVEADLRDPEACRRACDGTDLVFHQAALGSVPRSMKDPATSIAVNVAGTANLLAAARDAEIRRFVYASSSSVYGDSATLPKREGEEGKVLSPYAASKAMDEQLADVFHRAFGMETVGLRYFNVYGPRQRPDGPYAAVIPRFVDACLAHRAPIIHGDGKQSRDFTWVGDAVAANLLAAVAPSQSCGRSYNVAGGRRVTLLELAAVVRAATGDAPEPEHGPPRPGDVRHSLADLTQVADGLGYQPAVELDDGLARTVAWFVAGEKRPSKRADGRA
ncbi:MAG: SDR family NAD(P)-dependent oxidoreductase [Thermoanaerobaculia bacterium]|nr:SDR family NAD(P)-dependent oxidoreductase [Thermoanaerobaculia bacterium]